MKKIDLLIFVLILLIILIGGFFVYTLINNNSTKTTEDPEDASVSDLTKTDSTDTTTPPASLDQFNADYYEDLGVPAPTDTTNLVTEE